MFRLHSLGASSVYTHYLLDTNGEKVFSSVDSSAIYIKSFSSKNPLPRVPLPLEEKKTCFSGIYSAEAAVGFTIYGSTFCFTPKAKALPSSESTPAVIVTNTTTTETPVYPSESEAPTLSATDEERNAAIQERDKKQLLIIGGIVALVAVGGVIAYQVSKK